MQGEPSLEMEDLGIQDAKVADRVIHKAKRPSKGLKVNCNFLMYLLAGSGP